MRTVMLCFALAAGSALAQNAPDVPEAVREIRDVQLGMSRDHVLAGLGDKYDLTRIDDPKSQHAVHYGDEFWMVWPKDRSQGLPERESGAIRFWQGKAKSIEIDLYPSMAGEGALLAQRLFWLIYNRADPLTSSDKAWDTLYKESNARSAMLPVQLQDLHDDKHEDLKMSFTLDGKDFLITIRKKPGQPDSVDVEQTICCRATEAK